MTERSKIERITENLLRKAIAFIVVVSLAIPIMAPGVFAASSVAISGGENVKGGETFTVAVTFSGGDVGRVDAQMLYDTDAITYISGGTSKGDTGYIQLKSAGTEGAIVFNIKFQALTDGSTELQVTTNEMYDLDEMPMDTPTAYKTISITGDASSEEVVTEPPDEEEPEEPSSLSGVDEKIETLVNTDGESNIVMILIIIAAALFILIVTISTIAARSKKKKARKIRERQQALHRENDRYHEEKRIGRSGRPLDPHPRDDRRWSDDSTQTFHDWKIDDDDYKDIDKW